MDLIRRNPRLKRLALEALRLRIPPTPLHRLLLLERTLRRAFLYELMRICYYQPLFELQCAAAGQGCRLELTPDSKLPLVDNCELILGARVRVNARTTFQGARNAPATRPISAPASSSGRGWAYASARACWWPATS